jgi:hypothetical protein
MVSRIGGIAGGLYSCASAGEVNALVATSASVSFFDANLIIAVPPD